MGVDDRSRTVLRTLRLRVRASQGDPERPIRPIRRALTPNGRSGAGASDRIARQTLGEHLFVLNVQGGQTMTITEADLTELADLIDKGRDAWINGHPPG